MLDLATRWFEIIIIKDKHTATISNPVEKYWFCRYPRTTIITYDHGKEFLGHAFKNYLLKNE